MPIRYNDDNFFEVTGGTTLILGRVTWMKQIRQTPGAKIGFNAAKQAVDWFISNLRGFHINDADHFWKIYNESVKMAAGIQEEWIVFENGAWWVVEKLTPEEMDAKYNIRVLLPPEKITFVKRHEVVFYDMFVENCYEIPLK